MPDSNAELTDEAAQQVLAVACRTLETAVQVNADGWVTLPNGEAIDAASHFENLCYAYHWYAGSQNGAEAGKTLSQAAGLVGHACREVGILEIVQCSLTEPAKQFLTEAMNKSPKRPETVTDVNPSCEPQPASGLQPTV